MAGGKNVCEAVIHTVNLSAYKSASRNVPLSKCLLIAPCKTTRLPPCVNKNTPAIPHCPPCVPLRLCNPIETRTLCKQDSCYCRPKRPPMTASQKLGYTFGFAVKCGVIVGFIWITNEQGLWSGHHEITCLYGRITRRIQDWTSLDVGPKAGEYPEVPHLHNLTTSFIEYWNSTMAGFFNTVLFIPRTISSYYSDPSNSSDRQDGKKPPPMILKKGVCNM